MKEQLIQHLKEVQHDLQTKVGYGEVNGNNDLVNYYNVYFSNNYDPLLKTIKDEFYHLVLTFNAIASKSNQGHWRSVMSTQIGWFLTRNDI
jgi:hypothetical protein